MKAIRRFIARRGCPKKIFSDNGKNFIGCLGELIKLKKLVRERYNCDSLPQSVLDLGINLATIPARASHFGGLWEAAIRSMKLHLQKVVGKATRLQLDEMYTITCHFEAIMKGNRQGLPKLGKRWAKTREFLVSFAVHNRRSRKRLGEINYSLNIICLFISD